MNSQTAQNLTGFLPTLTILFCPSPSHTLYVALTWRPTETQKQHSIRLQPRFEAPNAVTLGDLKWQYIAIIATFSSFVKYNMSIETCVENKVISRYAETYMPINCKI